MSEDGEKLLEGTFSKMTYEEFVTAVVGKYAYYEKIAKKLGAESPQVIAAFLDILVKAINKSKLSKKSREKISLAFSGGLCDIVIDDFVQAITDNPSEGAG